MSHSMGQQSRGAPTRFRPLPEVALTLLLLLLPLLASAYRVKGATAAGNDAAQEAPGHSHHGPYHSHGGVLQKVDTFPLG